MKRVLHRRFAFFISASAGQKFLVGLCSPFRSLPLFPSGIFLFFVNLFFSFSHRVVAAAGFLPEQFFKLFTRRLAALTWCFGTISRGDILPVLPCSPVFALLLSPQMIFPCNRLNLDSLYMSSEKKSLLFLSL